MQLLNFDTNFKLGVESDEKKIRLIIYKNDHELVCRKTSLKEIKRFLDGSEERLFKGRLQLLKDHNHILIKAKKDIAGVTDRQALYKYLANIPSL
jgi:hypothetical protein